MVLPRVIHVAAERAGSWRRSLTGKGGCNSRRSDEVLPSMDGEIWLLRADLEEIGRRKTRSLGGGGRVYLRRVDKVIPCV
jgi:hypothetical protein